jgi:hypothetical protein
MSSFMPQLIMKNAADRAIREMCLEVCKRAIEKCSRIYGFDSSEAIEKLDLDSLCVVSKRVKDKNVKKNDVVGPSFHLPFCGVKIEGRCEGIRSNWTLLTQCMNVPSNGILCKSCEKEGEKNASGEPNLGLITKRIEMGDDFVDPKGRKPTHYSKYMEKHSLTEEAVIAEASKYGIVVDHSYLMTPTAHKNTKKNDSKVGRPQKERIPIEVNENAKPDLLEEAETLQSIEEEEEEEDTEVPVSSPVSPPVSTPVSTPVSPPVSPPVSAPAPAIVPVKKTKEQKEVPVKKTKEQKEAEKEAEKQRKEAEKEAEKQRKEAEKQAEKERKKAEKKAEKKTEKKTTVKKTKESVIEPEYVITDELTREPYDENSNSNEDEDEEQVVSVEKIIVEGVEYYRDTNSNEVYDKDTQDTIGMYINGEIVFNSDGNDDVNKVESENEDEEDEDEDEDEDD